MLIKTQDGERSVGSAGVAGTGLGLGIAGTALGVLAGGANGLFGNWFGGCRGGWNNWNNGCGCYGGYGVATADSRTISALESALANEKAERYSDQSDLKLFEDYTTRINAEKQRVNDNFTTIFRELVDSRERLQAEVCRIDKEAALNKQATEFNLAFLNNKIDTTDAATRCWASSTFVPGKLVMPISSICPQPLAGCTPIVANPQVITTTTATTEGEVQLNTARSK